jgi:hypothetical protein
MKTLSAALVGLAIALFAQVAAAYVAQVVTTVPLAAEVSVEDTAQLGAIVASAVQDVLAHAIAFTPTVVRIEDAHIIAGRLYLVLLIADAEGEAIIEGLGADPPSTDESDMPSDDETGESRGSTTLHL